MNKNYRLGLPPMPENIQRLQVDPERGYPVPFFVRWIGGKPEFRLVDPAKLIACIQKTLCWICGYPLPRNAPGTFVGGPLFALTRTSSEPPSHTDCARFACQACPFLVMPKMVRRLDNLPKSHDAPGIMLKRNPGVALMWTSMWLPTRMGDRAYIFKLSDPLAIESWREGRPAEKFELRESFDEGLLAAQDAIKQAGNPLHMLTDLRRKKNLALKTLGL